jgi:hypothetical protein
MGSHLISLIQLGECNGLLLLLLQKLTRGRKATPKKKKIKPFGRVEISPQRGALEKGRPC